MQWIHAYYSDIYSWVYHDPRFYQLLTFLSKPLLIHRFSPSWEDPQLPEETLCCGWNRRRWGSESLAGLDFSHRARMGLGHLAHLSSAYNSRGGVLTVFQDMVTSAGLQAPLSLNFQPLLKSGQESGTRPQKSFFSSVHGFRARSEWYERAKGLNPRLPVGKTPNLKLKGVPPHTSFSRNNHKEGLWTSVSCSIKWGPSAHSDKVVIRIGSGNAEESDNILLDFAPQLLAKCLGHSKSFWISVEAKQM